MKKEIPIFFATDNNYFPYMVVTIKSILDNASKDYFYSFHVLETSIDENNKKNVEKILTENSSIEYVNIKEYIEKIKEDLQLRDYYSFETYYRFFIDSLFPQYDKVIYLDCDIIVKGDISELYNKNISNYLVAAVQDQVMIKYKIFGTYVEKVLGVKTKKDFNAGVLLMNTKMFRAYNVQKRFFQLIKMYKFKVTQDEDYLNVICKNKVKYLDYGWNKMPFDDKRFNCKKVNLIHYNLNWKPWHYKHVLFEEDFWNYVDQTDYSEFIHNAQKTYTFEQKMADTTSFENLKKLAQTEIDNPSNYKKLIKMNENFLKKGTNMFLNLPGIKSLVRILNVYGCKIAYDYRKRQKKA